MILRFVSPGSERSTTSRQRRFVLLASTVAGASVGLAACSSPAIAPTAFDSTAVPSTSAPITTTVTAAADTWVDQTDGTTNFGSRNFITVRGSTESGLLRFDVPASPGRRITSAVLRLNSGKVAGSGVSVYSTTGTWSESAVTWRSAPPGGSLLATTGSYPDAAWASWNVLAAVPPAGGPVNFRVENPSSTWMGFLTKENGAATAPQLVITTTAESRPVASSTPAATGPAWTPPPSSGSATPSAAKDKDGKTKDAAGKNTSGSGSSASSPAKSAQTSSGAKVPAVTGWRKVYQDDFTGTSLGKGWGAYAGPIPSTPGGNWSGSMVDVSGGTLNLHTRKVSGVWTSGGVMNNVGGQRRYGKYLVRFRMDKANGVKYALLLWPKSGKWPDDGEIDFAEDGGGSRSATTGTLHWGTSASRHQAQRHAKANFSTWHTVGVEWTPGKVVYTLDGKAYGTIKTSKAPTKAMNLALQTEAGSCGQWMTCTDSTTPSTTTLQVDWVAVYARK